jgi:hypothetical protein
VRVPSCTQVFVDPDTRVFRCQVETNGCRRSFLFGEARGYPYPPQLYAAAPEALTDPCSVDSDPASAVPAHITA